MTEVSGSNSKQRAYSGGQGHSQGSPKGDSLGSRHHRSAAATRGQSAEEREKEERTA